MRIPVHVFDLVLATGAPPVVSLLREDQAVRAVQFLKQLAEGGQLYTPTGEGIHASGIAYHKRPTSLALPQQTIAEARKAGVHVDDTALDALLREAQPEEPPPAEEPSAEEPVADQPLVDAPPAEEPTPDAPAVEGTP